MYMYVISNPVIFVICISTTINVIRFGTIEPLSYHVHDVHLRNEENQFIKMYISTAQSDALVSSLVMHAVLLKIQRNEDILKQSYKSTFRLKGLLKQFPQKLK